MTADSTHTSPRSRRALLAGALGGLAAWAASTASRVDPAAATTGDPIRMGRLNRAGGTSTELQTNSSKPAFRAIQLGGGAALRGDATTGRGVMGIAGGDGAGVWGYSPGHYGVSGNSRHGSGVAGFATTTGTGVYGSAASGAGVYGVSEFGYGVHAVGSQFRPALYVDGFADVDKHIELYPSFEPPPPGGVKLFALVGGNPQKYSLCVRIESGPVVVLATQP